MRLGKRLLQSAFVVLAGLLLMSVFWRAEQQHLAGQSSSSPRVIVDNIQVVDFVDGAKVSELYANRAIVTRPNIVDFAGDVHGWQLEGSTYRTFSCGYLIAEFSSSDLLSSKLPKEIIKGNLRRNVELSRGDLGISSESVHYVGKNRKLFFGHDKVLIRNGSQELFGRDGFEYDVKAETIHLPGLISGSFYYDD